MNTPEKTALETIYNGQASMYAKLRRKKKSFDHTWRKELLAFAKGKILEVSVGAGANFRFYPPDVELIAVDLSPEMIKNARIAASETGVNSTFITSRVEDLNFAPESFDTIVSTLSLCAYDDPVAILNRFNLWCKKDGIILLLEHGVSQYDAIHWLQNKIDNFQYRKIGCHANRDMLEIVRHSDLQIKMYERKLMGVIYLIWATPER